jgi:hypothetical protein
VSVTVPDELAGPLRTLAIMAAEALMRENGDLPLARGLVSLLDDLGRAARGRPCDPLGPGRNDDSPGDSPRSATCREASVLMGVGARHARRLAAAGAVIAVKRGRDWSVDLRAAEDFGKAHNVGKLDGPRADRDVTKAPIAGRAPAAPPAPAWQPPAQEFGNSTGPPDSPLATSRTSVSSDDDDL